MVNQAKDGLRRGAGVFLAAFAVRAVLILQWAKTPYYLTPRLDDAVYLQWAQDILHGGLSRQQAFYQSPFYPYFMAAVFKLFGFHPALVLWLQAVAGALACVALLRLTERLFGARAGLIAGALACLYRPFLFDTVFLLKESWLVLGLALFCLAAARAMDSGKRLHAAAAGALLGLSALNRSNALYLALMPAWAWFQGRQKRRKPPSFALGPFALALALTILPATVHNYRASRELILINYTTGFSVFIGNNPEATGTTNYPLGVSSYPTLEEKQSSELARRLSGRELGPAQISRFWLGQSLKFMAAEPWSWLALTWHKFVLFWNSVELPDDYSPTFIRRHTPTLLGWPLVSYPWVALFGVAGAFALALSTPARRSLVGMGLLFMLSVVGSFVTERYRAPVAVFLIPFASACLEGLLSQRIGWLRKHAQPLALSLPLIVICEWPLHPFTARDEAAGWITLCQVNYVRGDFGNALAAFTQAVQTAPEALDEPAFLCGVASAEKANRPAAAALIYDAALERIPKSAKLKEHDPRRK